jgi:hypothetical protein
MRIGKPAALVVIATIMGAFGDSLVGTVSVVGCKAVVALAVWMVSTVVVAAAKSASRGSDTVWALLVAAAAAAVWLV